MYMLTSAYSPHFTASCWCLDHTHFSFHPALCWTANFSNAARGKRAYLTSTRFVSWEAGFSTSHSFLGLACEVRVQGKGSDWFTCRNRSRRREGNAHQNLRRVHRRGLRGCGATLDQNSWAMPEEHEGLPTGGGEVSSIFDSASFLAGLMPKKEIGAERFLQEHPDYDGRGVVVAIFDSGVDPAAAGLQTTTDGKPKIIDVVDCTGSGDVDTSTVVQADEDGHLIAASGVQLRVNKSWKNPSGKWHVGSKFAYQLFPDTLVNRLKKERKKKWDKEHRESLIKALRQLTQFDLKHSKPSDISLRKEREDLQTRIDLLQKVADTYEDKGPVIDAVVWNDGEHWRVALDTQDMEAESGIGKLADFIPLTNYKIEHKYGIFTRMDACSFVTNVYDNGNVLSIVTDSSPHGTHVAGITAAYHPEEPLLNGVAPGAQLVSCKIGDSRLGSMETGTGLTRALITVIENKCNLINMSYGEPTTIPNHGRFVELVDEVVNKHGVIFVSSAGNNGPSLSTVGAPGGTSSNIIGIGAFVSPVMAAAAHSIVEPPSEGLQYTWSSRGPTTDGDLGVCLSAPGGAVAPVPKWTLQSRMLMNGTSMASPCACGGIALVLSALKAESRNISPHVVRKALENTAIPGSSNSEELLTTGRGLLQVDRAYDYLLKCNDMPSVSYKVQVSRSSSTNGGLRGIYLREIHDVRQTSEWTVQVKPQFHEDADKLELLVPFEERVQLESSAPWVKAPEFLLLTNNGRNFNVMVDPTGLKEGVHYTEVVGVDTSATWRGPLFRLPITIVKPMEVVARPPVVTFSNLSFMPGHIERKFVAVPEGATWAEAGILVAGFDTPRRFYITFVQIVGKQRPIVRDFNVAFTSPTSKSFTFAVEGGVTMELCCAQFWSSGIGSLVSTSMEVQVTFHGLEAGQKQLLLHGTEGTCRVDVKAPLSMERVSPSGSLKRVRMSLRPVESKLAALSADRDMLPNGRQISALILTYKFNLTEGGKIKPSFPFLNNRLYEAQFESQFYMITDANKRILSFGDCYPKGVKLPKGEYTLRINIRHDNISYLEKLMKATAFIDRTLDDKSTVKLSFYSHIDGAVTGKSAFRALNLLPGECWPFYIASPPDEKLPKDAVAGTVLIGKVTLGTDYANDDSPCPSSSEIFYVIPPAFKKKCQKAEEKSKDKSTAEIKKSIKQRIDDEVRDAKMKVLSTLSASTSEERKDWDDLVATFKAEYPNHLQLFVEILQKLTAFPTMEDELIIKTADEVISLIDRDALARFFSMKSEAETADAVQVKKEMEGQRDALAEALYRKGLSLANLEEKNLKNSASTENAERVVAENGGATREPTEATEFAAEKDARSQIRITTDQSKGDTDLTATHEVDTLIATSVLTIPTDSNGAVTAVDEFDENYAELRKWADMSAAKYGLLTVKRERRAGRLGTAIKALNELIQDDSKPPQKYLYELRVILLVEIGWIHWAAYETKWIATLFPTAYSLF